MARCTQTRFPSTWGNTEATQHCALSSIFNCGNMPLGLKGCLFLHQTKETYMYTNSAQRKDFQNTSQCIKWSQANLSLALIPYIMLSKPTTMKSPYNSLPWNIMYWWVQFNKKLLQRSICLRPIILLWGFFFLYLVIWLDKGHSMSAEIL